NLRRGRAVDRHGAHHADGPELLRHTLYPSAKHGIVVVDIDERAGTGRLAFIGRGNTDKTLEILADRWFEQLVAGVAYILVVRHEHAAAPWVFTRLEARRQKRNDRIRISPIFHRQEGAGEMPGRRWRKTAPST